MAKANGNGKNLVERTFGIDEIEKMRKRVIDIHDQLDSMKDKRKTLLEEEKETRGKIKLGYEMVEGEELPFKKGEQRA